MIKQDTRKLLTRLNKPNLAKILKFYEIIIDMQRSNTKKNKREIFYQSVNVFKTQDTIDRLIHRFYKMYNITQQDLLITTSLKGLFNGDVDILDCPKMLNTLIPDLTNIDSLKTNAKIVLVIEKDSLFALICNLCRNISLFNNVIFVTGKGYPCKNTTLFLKLLEKQCLIYGLFDYDPFGMHIYTVYKNGTKNNPIKISSMMRIGMNAKDVFEYKINEAELLELNIFDNKMLKKLIKIEELNEDVLFLKGLGKKMEMEMFTGKNSNFILEYLINKMKLK